MCMRDRISTVAGLVGMVPEELVLLTSVAFAVGVVRLAPVSYTTLRAHETKVNLVCCLLLEKKKPPLHARLSSD